MFKVNIELTWSKIMAILILIAGSIYSYITNDSGVMITTIGAVVAVLGIKQVSDSNKSVYSKENKYLKED